MVFVTEMEKNGQNVPQMEFMESGNQMWEMRKKNFLKSI